MDVLWLDGQANVPGIVEKICPMRHIRQEEWQSQWNEKYLGRCCYDYISDYECIFNHPIDLVTKQLYIDSNPTRWLSLQAAKQQGTRRPITNLAHFTSPVLVETIIEKGGFCGGLKKINVDVLGQDIKANLSWWSPTFTPDDIAQVRGTIGAAIMPFPGPPNDPATLVTLATLQNQFATSDAFIPNGSRYGTSYLQYNINDLCQYYSNQFGGVQFKILGTFGYKQEVMHAVLVCNQANGAGMFAAYPDVLTPEQDISTGSGAVVTRDAMGNWMWKPQATRTEIRRLVAQNPPYPMFRRWENVAFAFHLPVMWGNVPSLSNNLLQLTIN